MADISLFELVTPDQDQDAFVNTVDMMLKISYQVEDIVIDNELPVDFYAGFQRFSHFRHQAKRYRRLADVARRVFVFGEADSTPPTIPGVQFVPLPPGSALIREWFLVVNTPGFFTALLTQEIPGADPIRRDRRFRGLWTHDEAVVGNAHLLVTQVLGQPFRPVLGRDYRAQNRYLVRMSNKIVQYSEASNLSRAQSESSLGVLSQVALQVSARAGLDESLQAVTTALRQTFQARTARLYLRNGEGQLHLKAASAATTGEGIPAEQSPLPAEGAANTAVRERRPLTIPDTQDAGEPDPLDHTVRSLVAVPLLAGPQALGVLLVGRDLLNGFDASALLLLTAVGAQVSLAIERQELLTAQENTERMLQITMAAATDAILMTDAGGRITQMNRAAEDLFGVPATDLHGRPLTQLQNAPLDDLCREAQARGGDAYKEVPVTGGRTALAGAALVRNAGQAPIGWVIVLHTLDAARAAAGGPLPNSLPAGNEAASLPAPPAEAGIPVDQDLDNRLRTLSGLTAMLPNRIALDEDQTRYVGQIIKLTRETARLVNNLVYLNGIEHHPGFTTTPGVNLNDLLREVVEKFAPLATRKGVSLTLDAMPGVQAAVNATAVQRAVQYLVDNAIKYTPAGGTIVLRLDAYPTEIQITVSDTGIGLWPRDTGLVFNRFYRVINQQNQDVPSGGLGLAVVKAVAERHGGRTWVESTLGQGSTFGIALPAA